jgi:hypothetical protein
MWRFYDVPSTVWNEVMIMTDSPSEQNRSGESVLHASVGDPSGRHPSLSSDTSLATSRSDRARSLDSVHEVERRAGSPGPPRPDEWRHDLLEAVVDLSDSLHEQYLTSSGEQGLLSQVVREMPHLDRSVTELRERQSALAGRLDDLRAKLGDHTRDISIDEVRHEVASLTAEMRELRAWEADVVYEAYSVDLGVGG